MVKRRSLKCKSITADCIMGNLSLYVPCLKKPKVTKKGLVVKPMIFNDMNSGAQVDLINIQSQAGGQNKWILVYQDHFTKFCIFDQLHLSLSLKLLSNCWKYLVCLVLQVSCKVTVVVNLPTL